ncbi:MAG: PucR family transcriptional regulator ligand-binding domain-containing protein, partial [Anaerovoracaceae bacterium]|nr:PucR family transcriptional regulator ligand-binding domain-containing protein [Anaerovoracaceae bacterium]
MKITFRDCLQLSVLSRGAVVAGEKNLDNRVKNISVLDASCPEEAVLYNGKPEELILTAFSGMKKNTEMQVETIKELAKTGVAGIVILQRENAADY